MPFVDAMLMAPGQIGGGPANIGTAIHSNVAVSAPPWQVVNVFWPEGPEFPPAGDWSVPSVVNNPNNGAQNIGSFVLSAQAARQVSLLNEGATLVLMVKFNQAGGGGTPEQLKVRKESGQLVYVP